MRKVKVLLASYNGFCFLEKQIISILGQVGVNVELHVSDDRSSDGTIELLEAFKRNNINFSYSVNEVSSGAAGQNFFGLIRNCDFSDADYVALSDQDDVWFSDKLIKAISSLESSGASGYSAPVVAKWLDGSTKILSQNSSVTEIDFLFEGAGQGCTFVLPVSSAILVKNVFNKFVDLTRSIHYHDWAIYAVLRSRGHDWFFDKNPVMYYTQHGGNDTGARGGIGSIVKRLRLIRSGWYVKQIRSICLLVQASADGFVFKYGTDGFLSGRTARFNYDIFLKCRRRLADRVVISFSMLFGWVS